MSGIRNFIIGFCLSLFSVTLCGRLNSSTSSHVNFQKRNQQVIRMDLFKGSSDTVVISPQIISSNTIKKQSLEIADNRVDNPVISNSPDGIEDDEILSINFDDQIPIELSSTSNEEPLLPSTSDIQTDKVALLPDTDKSTQEETQSIDTPWVAAKTNKTQKNKDVEHILNTQPGSLFTENIQQLAKEDEHVSYKVAERIKQSIIFPIPDEILNDENLVPTFIQDKKDKTLVKTEKKAQSKKASPSSQIINKKDTTFKQPAASPVTKEASANSTDSGILDSISSWFNSPKGAPDSELPSAPESKKKKSAPTYSSTPVNNANNYSETKDNSTTLAEIYASLQETKQEYTHQRIAPSELKLSFQPQRAEISGSTLTWLKVFSEAAMNDDVYLQVRLDASASTALQRKRLNLLYTIFMNNGVSFDKVNTVFTATEPNAFIIRTIRIR